MTCLFSYEPGKVKKSQEINLNNNPFFNRVDNADISVNCVSYINSSCDIKVPNAP